jgi:hypothetical protein
VQAGTSPVGEEHSQLSRRIGRTWLAAGLGLIAVAGLTGAVSAQASDVVRLTVGDRSLLLRSDDEPGVRNAVETLQAEAQGGPVFVGAADMSKPTLTWAMLYHLMPSGQVTAYYLEIPPGLDPAQEHRLVADIENAEALLLTPFSEANRERLFPHVDDLSQAPNEAVLANFCRRSPTPLGTVWSAC